MTVMDNKSGVAVGLDATRGAVDPRGAGQHLRNVPPPNNAGRIVYPGNVDLTRAFSDLYMQFWHVNGAHPTNLKIDHVERVAQRCVHVTGHVNLAPNEPDELIAVLCTTPPGQMGNYLVMLSSAIMPIAVADQQRATVGAILASFQVDQRVLTGEINSIAGPAIDAIHKFGAMAMKNADDASRAHQAQNESWRAGQDSQDKRNQGFSNYLLDQNVIRDVQDPNTHKTVWNQTADVWQKAFPDRIEIVPTSEYIKGQDYR